MHTHTYTFRIIQRHPSNVLWLSDGYASYARNLKSIEFSVFHSDTLSLLLYMVALCPSQLLYRHGTLTQFLPVSVPKMSHTYINYKVCSSFIKAPSLPCSHLTVVWLKYLARFRACQHRHVVPFQFPLLAPPNQSCLDNILNVLSKFCQYKLYV